ncbi:hypothetical protein THRCLA_11072 [Thraustotheca clavata]|uniref:Transmembrane protein n=1 Tax=Thraustotheca clavata TaxID=74557 RepID=A0A1V9Y8Y0_9STRA|nr:hypothetical protein THRCLA_11072 [Thraustotheca clavata]
MMSSSGPPLEESVQAALVGSIFAFKGCALAAGLPELRNSYKKTLWWLAGISAVLIIIGATVAWPIQFVLWLFLGSNSVYTGFMSTILQKWVNGVPFVLIAFCRYVHPTLVDNLFFIGLGEGEKTLVPILSSIPVTLFDWAYLKSTLLFLLYRLAFFIIMALGSYLTPLFGSIFAMIAFGFKIQRTEMFMSSFVFVLYLIPYTRPFAVALATIWFDARAITKEVFYPVFARKAKLIADHGIPCSISQRQSTMLFGFSYTLSYFVQVPVVGPFVWLLAFIAAGMVAPRMFDLTKPAKKL